MNTKKIFSIAAAALMTATVAVTPALAKSYQVKSCDVKFNVRKANSASVIKDGMIGAGEYDKVDLDLNPDTTSLLLGYIDNKRSHMPLSILESGDFALYTSWDEVHGFNFAVRYMPATKIVQEQEQPTDHALTEMGGIMAPEDAFIQYGGIMFRINGQDEDIEFSHSIAKRTDTGDYLNGHYGEHGIGGGIYTAVGGRDCVVKYEDDGHVTYEWSLPFSRILGTDQPSGGEQFQFCTSIVEGGGDNQCYSVCLGDRGYLTEGGRDSYQDAVATISNDVIPGGAVPESSGPAGTSGVPGTTGPQGTTGTDGTTATDPNGNPVTVGGENGGSGNAGNGNAANNNGVNASKTGDPMLITAAVAALSGLGAVVAKKRRFF